MKLYPCDSLVENYSGVLVNHYYCGKVHGMPSKSDLPNVYYISSNEIPCELCGENIISSHVKTKGYLHTGRNHHCYGYMINSAFHSKKILVWFFNVFFLVEKYFTRPLRIFARPCNILYIRASTNDHLSATATFLGGQCCFSLSPQGGCCGDVQLYFFNGIWLQSTAT